MKKYIVEYYFDGNGEVEINAKSKIDAQKKFFEGEFKNEKEWGEQYNVWRISPKE